MFGILACFGVKKGQLVHDEQRLNVKHNALFLVKIQQLLGVFRLEVVHVSLCTCPSSKDVVCDVVCDGLQ